MNKTAIRALSSLALGPLLAAAPQLVLAQSTFTPNPETCLDPETGRLLPELTAEQRAACIAAGYGGSAPPPPPPPPPGTTSSALAPLGTALLATPLESARGRLGQAQERQQAARSGKRPLGFYGSNVSDLFGRDADFRVRSASMTVGFDKRLNDAWVLGTSAGLLRSRTRFFNNNSYQHSTGGSATAYSSWSPTATSYLLSTLVYEGRSFNLARDSGTGMVSTARTRGRTVGLSLGGGNDFSWNSWSVSPYARWDLLRSRVAAFDESGSTDAVSVGTQRARSRTLNIGTNVQYTIAQSWGTLLPYARLELTRRTDKNLESGPVRLLADGSALLVPTDASLTQDYGTMGLGLMAITPYGYRAFIDYQTGFKLNGYRLQSVSAGLRFEL